LNKLHSFIRNKNHSWTPGIIAGAVGGIVVLLVLVLIVVIRRRKRLAGARTSVEGSLTAFAYRAFAYRNSDPSEDGHVRLFPITTKVGM